MVFVKGDPNINRKGKRKGSISIVARLRKKLREFSKETKDDKEKRQFVDDLLDEWINQAMKEKNFNALREMVRYIDGMPKQTIEMEDNTAKENIKTLREIADVLNQREGDSKTDS
jgi:hypothetical protein